MDSVPRVQRHRSARDSEELQSIAKKTTTAWLLPVRDKNQPAFWKSLPSSSTILSMSKKLWPGLVGAIAVIVVVGLQYVEHWTLVEHAIEDLKNQGPVGVFLAGVLMSRVFPLVLAVGAIVVAIDTRNRQRELEEREQARPIENGAVNARTKREIYEINGKYLPGLPTDNGWKFVYGEEKQPSFIAPQDADGIGGIELFCPYKTYKIEYLVPEPYASLTDELELNIKYGRDAMFWVVVNVTSGDGVSQKDCRLLKIVVGKGSPYELKDYPKEHVVSVMPDPLQNGWVGFRLRLPDLVAAAVARLGYVYRSIKAVQIRGCISISPIKFLSPIPVEASQISRLPS